MSQVQLAVTAEPQATINMAGVQQFPVSIPMQVVQSHIIQQPPPPQIQQLQQQQQLVQQPQIHIMTNPNDLSHVMQNQQQPQPQLQVASLQNQVPMHLTCNTQVSMDTQLLPQPVHQQTITYPVQSIAVNPQAIKPKAPSAEPSASTNVLRTKKGKKQMSRIKRSQQQAVLPKEKILQSHTHRKETSAPAEKPTARKRKRPRMKPEDRKYGLKQKGKHSMAVQTQQSKEELLLELNLTVKAKLKEHVNTMNINQMKEALYRLSELQPGLVFDVVVGQLAAQRREIEKRDIYSSQVVNYDEIAMKRSGKGYIIQGHLYEGDRHDKEKGRIYLKCHKVKSGCRARARIIGSEAVVMQTKHNHSLPNIIEMRFWNKAREEATKEEHRRTPMAKVYHIAKSAFLAEAKDDEERVLWSAKIPSFKSVESGMRLQKSKVFGAPPNISMLDTTFDNLRDRILSGTEDADTPSQSTDVAAGVSGRDSLQTKTSESAENQGPTYEVVVNSSQDNNIQIRTDSQNNMPTNTGFHGDMQVDSDVQNIQNSNVPQVGGNSAAVQSLLAISNQLQEL